jgi:nitrite reductase/ring-hydroxylating ferredoxin subunit
MNRELMEPHSFNPQVLKFIPPEQISDYLKKLHPGMAVTHGHHESLVPGYIRDLEWNFYDELHRYHVHSTYDDMYKVMAGNYFSINVVRWGNLPVFIQVANAKIADGLFYQSMTILGIICLHQVQRLIQKGDEVLIDINWYTASHWLFRWLHAPFNRRLLKLQRKQDREDNEQIRGRRRDLRHRGFSFLTDDANFINSNSLLDHVRLPKMAAAARINLGDYAEGVVHRIACEPMELMLRRRGNEVEVWPGICPHEGALIAECNLRNETVICPWHGRRFPAVVLSATGRAEWQYLTVSVTHKGDHLEVAERSQGDRSDRSSADERVSASG